MKTENSGDEIKRRFAEHRPRLRLLALRILGTVAEADDALQEAWLKVSRADTQAIENWGGWLTTVTSRVCLDLLRTRKARRETLVGLAAREVEGPATLDPEREALLAEAVGSALAVVLGELTPPERVAYVLHDLFDVPFGDVAVLLDRSEVAARQLASRARRRVQAAPPGPDTTQERHVVQAFFAASREGQFDALLKLLSPDAEFRADAAGVKLGATEALHGAQAIAERVLRAPRATGYALVDARPALVGVVAGHVRVVLTFTFQDGVIAAMQLTADPDTIAAFDVVLVEGESL